jgi:hypothetical protein
LESLLEIVRDRLSLRKVKSIKQVRAMVPDMEAIVLWHNPELGTIIIDEEVVLSEIRRIIRDPTIMDKAKAIRASFMEKGWDVLLPDIDDILARMV